MTRRTLRILGGWRGLVLWSAALAIAAVTSPLSGLGNAVVAEDRCSAPGNITSFSAALPHVSTQLMTGEPVSIVALGSSSTEGVGATRVENNYPSQLAKELGARLSGTVIRVLNRGVSGEATQAMVDRIDRDVIAAHPSLVIWQVGTNDVLHDDVVARDAALMRAGVHRMKAAGIDVILMDIQYAPAVLSHESYRDMQNAIAAVGAAEGVPVFRRFQLMQSWDETGVMPTRAALADDRLHMNDRSYGCLARLLADDIVMAAR